jgi:DNA-binding GntR family transcriptional regulator
LDKGKGQSVSLSFNASTPLQSAEDSAYTYILRKIREGEFKAAERLRAEELAADIGVSRMPVREALRRLASEGLVVLRPNRGAIVAQYTADQLFELFEIRAALEGLAARIAAAQITDDEVDELEMLVRKMSRAGQVYSLWSERHWAFHTCICRLSGRNLLTREIQKLHNLLDPYLRIWFSHAKPMDVTSYHEALVRAIASKNPSVAEAKMKEHVLNTASAVANFLRIEPHGDHRRNRVKSPRKKRTSQRQLRSARRATRATAED